MTSEKQIGSRRIELVQGNIVHQSVDAIVNAANAAMLGGGGVDGAIHRAAGPELLAACREVPADANGKRCPTGEARITAAGALAAQGVKHVIHGVGPVYDVGDPKGSAALLGSVHEHALRLAAENECRTVAFPAISTGVYRFPIADAAGVALSTAARFLVDHDGPVECVRFVLFSEHDHQTFARALGQLD